MKIIVALVCTFLLSSCVYYSVQGDFGGGSSAPCNKGSSQENATCKSELKRLNNEINKQAN
jgi:hypothetical protein